MTARKIVRADRLIDGTGGEPLAYAEIIIENGRVVSVGPTGRDKSSCDTEVLEFPGCTIMPGLIDTHVHLNLPGDGTSLEKAVREPKGVLLATAAFNAARALAAGITTVRDVGGQGATILHLRRALELGYGQGARIISCGQPITMTGGHTWYFGGEADGEEQLRKKVRDLVKLGADFIKVMASGGGTANTMSWLPSFTRSEFAAIVNEAHRLGRKVTAHCLCADSTRNAIAVGVDQVEHAGFICDARGNQNYEPEIADDLAKAGIPVTGTLAVGGAVIATLQARQDRTPDESALLTRWKRMLDQNLQQFRHLHQAGVQFVAGTDAGWRYTTVEALPLEMQLMHEGGCAVMDVIVAATGRAAQVIGVGHDRGTLEPNKCADVIVVKGNPLESLNTLHDPVLVMQGGVVCSRGQSR